MFVWVCIQCGTDKRIGDMCPTSVPEKVSWFSPLGCIPMPPKLYQRIFNHHREKARGQNGACVVDYKCVFLKPKGKTQVPGHCSTTSDESTVISVASTPQGAKRRRLNLSTDVTFLCKYASYSCGIDFNTNQRQ